MGKYAVFSGRASRSEFWQFTLAMLVFSFVAMILDSYVSDRNGNGVEVFLGIVMLVHLLPSLAVSVRRLHDRDLSGWLLLINLIPLGSLVVLIWACLRGTPGPNRFGPDPLQPATAAPQPAPARYDMIAEIERLAQLRASGSLTEAEFEVMKAQAMSAGRTA